MKNVLIFLLLIVVSARADLVDDYVNGEMTNQHIPGVALAVLTNGVVAKAQGYGWADEEGKVAVATNTLFQIQSVTKIFTATATMLLAEEGKIDIDKKISAYLDNLPKAWSNVTVRHLLTHTSGIKDFINEPTVDLTKDVTPDEIVQSLSKLPLNFQPGEEYRYSNTGYQLLGMIIHRLTGMPWHEFVRRRVLVPAGMASTRVNSLDVQVPVAHGYCWEKDKMRPGYPVAMSILSYPGGGLLSSVVDLAAWDRCLYGETVLKRSVLEKMWTPATFNSGAKSEYGLGWWVEDYHGHRFVSHGGAHMTGFKTTFTRFVDEKVTVVVLCNQRAANPANMAIRIAGFYIPGLILSSMPDATDPRPDFSKHLRETLTKLSKGEASSDLTPEFRDQYQKDKTRSKTLADRLKDAKGFQYLGMDDVAGRGITRYESSIRNIYYYKMPLKEGARYYTFYVAAEDKLAFYQSSEF